MDQFLMMIKTNKTIILRVEIYYPARCPSSKFREKLTFSKVSLQKRTFEQFLDKKCLYLIAIWI